MILRKALGIAITVLAAGCVGNQTPPADHSRNANFLLELKSAGPASWRGKNFEKCGYFAHYASDFEKSGKSKQTPSNQKQVEDYDLYLISFALLMMEPLCLRGSTTTGNLVGTVDLFRAVGSSPPEAQLSPTALDYYQRGIARGATNEELMQVIQDGKLEEFARLHDKFLPITKQYPNRYIWPLR